MSENQNAEEPPTIDPDLSFAMAKFILALFFVAVGVGLGELTFRQCLGIICIFISMKIWDITRDEVDGIK